MKRAAHNRRQGLAAMREEVVQTSAHTHQLNRGASLDTQHRQPPGLAASFLPTCCSSISLRASTMGGSRMDAGVTRRRAAYAVAKPSSADATCGVRGMGGTAVGWNNLQAAQMG